MRVRQDMCLPSQQKLRTVVPRGVYDLSGSARSGYGRRGVGAGHGEPAVLMPVVAFKAGVNMRAGAHQSGNNRQYSNAEMLDFSMQAFREAHGGKLRSTVGKQVRHADPAADGSYIDD